MTRFSSGSVVVEVPDPFHAETVAHLLGLAGPADYPALPTCEDTGAGAHSAWRGNVRGVVVEVCSALRPGALPRARPRGWSATAGDLVGAAG
ncbi:hypothetical protein [Myceligenerans pegani]|uniref:Uncharacterized protein n=1 Tax=Myceligenerans pegani TaxID=2776917 RepID=A0ABR9N531_9MICO|nr:hypothetical protein [Myceligenerans sp. TRM 65318]MBE1878778.1 hypothetical protein [Myceligenerans sp. TRM 65318]MBE3021049.1 hypothetical protein [Myceligenerans sp. TRM 65318]